MAAVVAVAVVVGSGWLWATYRNFDAGLHRIRAIDASTALKSDIDGSAQNILMVGSDDRSTATAAERKAIGVRLDGGATLTDTMMLLHVPANGKKASAISFPRDSWVAIPGHGMDKLNAAYGDGMRDAQGKGVTNADAIKASGARLLIRTLENLTSLTIDHYVAVDLIGFYRISNAIGGVEVCLNAAQNPSTEGDASHPHGYSGINLKKGNNLIKGAQALAFVRQRHGLPRGDLDRIVRQQYFLAAVFRKVASAGVLLNPIKLQNLLKAVSSSMVVDGTSGKHNGMEPLSLAQQLQKLSAGKLTFSTLPTTPDVVDGQSILRVDAGDVPVFIGKILGTNTRSAYTSAAVMAPSKVKVSVLNGTATPKLATQAAATLAKVGFTTDVGDSSAAAATTVIRYPAGMEAQAKTVAQYVPKATPVLTTDVSVVTLVLGSDGHRASTTKSVPAAAPSAKKVPSRTAAQAGCIN